MKREIAVTLCLSAVLVLVLFIACGGGGGGGGDPYIVQELHLSIPTGLPIDSIASDGSSFWVYSGFYGDQAVYHVNTNGSHIFSYHNPSIHPIKSLEHGDSALWAFVDPAGGGSSKVLQLDTSGAVMSSFEVPWYVDGAMAYWDSTLWMPSTAGGSSTVIVKYDLTGTQTGTAKRPQGTVLTMGHDGTNIWMVIWEDFGIYKLDTAGNTLDFFALDSLGGGLACDGTYIWMSHAPSRIDAYDFN